MFLELLAWHRRISAYDAVQQRSMKEHVLILQRREHFQIKLEIRNFFKRFFAKIACFFISSCMHEKINSKHTHRVVHPYQLYLVIKSEILISTIPIRGYGNQV